MQQPSNESSRRKFRPTAMLAGAVAVGAVAATGVLGGIGSQAMPAHAQAVQANVAQPLPSFADVIDRVKPAVVSVRVKRMADQVSLGSSLDGFDLPDGHPFQDLFKRFQGPNGNGPRGVRPTPRSFGQSQGSGFFISSDGYLVTNNHVIEKGSEVQVVMDDGRTLDAKVVGTDSKTDLALLKVEGKDFAFVQLAPAVPRIGDWVIAIGNPFGLGGTVTAGIISAQNRDIGAGPYNDFLQIDAAVNRGNSGGPAFNLRGEVVGVNTAIFSPSGGNVGLAFAIPASTVQLVVDQLKQGGTVSRGYLGVQIQPVTKEIAEGLDLKTEDGALVANVQDGTPAAKAGLKPGDVITGFNGQPVADARDLTRKVAALKPGTKSQVNYLRNGQEQTTAIELGQLPNDTTAKAEVKPDNQQPKLGLQLAPATKQDGSRDAGVSIVGVDPQSPAAEKGIKSGDVILEVGGLAVSKPEEVVAGVDAARKQGRNAVLLRVKSGNDVRFVAVALPKVG